MTLAEFYAARLAEDEAAVRRDLDSTLPMRYVDADADSGPLIDAFGADRVLREAEAGRLLLAELAGAKLAYEQASSVRINTRDRTEVARYDATVGAAYAAWRSLQRVVLARAAVWSEHPDYQAGWKP